jgi:lipoprotein-anchoring transpeptidase ErfK/SrfK
MDRIGTAFGTVRTRSAMVAAVLVSIVAFSGPAESRSERRAGDGARSGDVVPFAHDDYPIGSIVIVNVERKLYYLLGDGQAMRYPIAIGTIANKWTGKTFIQSKAKNPAWRPPWNPGRVVPGGPGNPLGARALYLDWGLYRIHGTNAPGSIGSAASNGCFRMHNYHVKDLYERVHLGAPVFVVESLRTVQKSASR